MQQSDLELYGRIDVIQDHTIVYDRGDSEVDRMRIDDVHVAAEMTSYSFGVDYWIILVAQDCRYISIPFYAEGRDALLQVLERRFQSDYEWRLVGSTALDSSIVWPVSLRGKPLFSFSITDSAPQSRPFGLLWRIAMAVLNPGRHKSVICEIRPEISAYLRELNTKGENVS